MPWKSVRRPHSLWKCPFISRDFYAIRPLILRHILGPYFWLIWGVGVVEIVFTPKLATQRFCYRGPKPQKCPKWLGEGAKGAKVPLHWCKRLLGDLCSLGPKHLLHPLLTTLGTFEVSGPCSRTFGSQPQTLDGRFARNNLLTVSGSTPTPWSGPFRDPMVWGHGLNPSEVNKRGRPSKCPPECLPSKFADFECAFSLQLLGENMTPKDPFLEGTSWDKFWRPIRSRALLFTPESPSEHRSP